MGRLSDAAFGGEFYVPPAPNEKTAQQITRRGDPPTSYRAASGVLHKLQPVQLRVMAELKRAGESGLTDFELEEICGDHGSTFRTRRAELVEVGLVRDSGRLRQIKGQNRIVWVTA